MPSNNSSTSLNQNDAEIIFKQAHADAQLNHLAFSGTVSPQDAWALFQSGFATIIDVRTNEERKFVGYVPESKHVPWATGTSFNRNPRFVKELETKGAAKEQVILLLCRSGKRSAAAATAAAAAGFEHIYNIEQGFEGDLDESLHRGAFNGWKYYQLPWQQD